MKVGKGKPDPSAVEGAHTIPVDGPETEATKQIYFASQWKLMSIKFRKHKLAVVALIVIIIMYLSAIFAPFIAPYAPTDRHRGLVYVPPQPILFLDDQGFSLRPFIHPISGGMNPETFQREYLADRTRRVYVRFFAEGPEYRLFGLIPTNIHLFGVDEGSIHLFGTDNSGRDVFSRVLYGGQISMSIGLVGVFISLFLGLLLGGISGYFGGAVDNIIQRIIEVVRSFPQIPLWMALSAAIPPRISPVAVYFGISVILSLVGWTGLARATRSKVLAIKNEDFVVAARIAGTSEGRIIGTHLIPSFMSHIIASLTLRIPQMILAETALSFLGIGLRPPIVSWGVMLQQAQSVAVIELAPWLLIPGAFVVLFVLVFNFMGDGLRDAADPYGT